MLCLEVAKRITLLMLEVAAAEGSTIATLSDAELEAIRDRSVASLERERPGTCELLDALPDETLRIMIRNSLNARNS